MEDCDALAICFELHGFYAYNTFAFNFQIRGSKGPIFEDGPSFETAFRLFHGKDGIVPLSGKPQLQFEKIEAERAPKFDPLAAKAATISLSSFGPGGPFGFDFFSEKWKKQKKSSGTSKKKNSHQVCFFELCKYYCF